jgi:predicted transcriptional regulator
MSRHKIQDLRSLREEMKAVARGERRPPKEAARPSFNSVGALARLLTPENRRLLAIIRDRKPQSVAELADMTGRAGPNLTRTLAKLEAAGFVRMRGGVGRRKAPVATARKMIVEIDPYGGRDKVRAG